MIHKTPDLFDKEPSSAPFVPHSATSKTAAKRIEPNAGTLRAEVLTFLRETKMHGATDEEMQRALDMNPSTQRPRRVELVNAGLVYDSQTVRLTDSKRSAVVWMAAERQP